MELSPEEKNKIYEEEKVRAGAQEKIKKEKEGKEAIIKGISTLIAVIIVIGLGWYFYNKLQTLPEAPSSIDLKGDMSFDGRRFTITNYDDFDWTNIKLEINPGFVKGGFVLKIQKIGSGKTLAANATEFAKADGTILNPLIFKPQKLFISCDTPKGKGFGGWGEGWEK